MKTTWLTNGWYPARVGFVPSPEAWVKTMKKLKCDMDYPHKAGEAGAHCAWLRDENDNCVILVTTGKIKDPLHAILGLAHESVHVWQFIKEHIGEDKAGHEQEAYAIENILVQLLAAYSDAHPKAPWQRKKK